MARQKRSITLHGHRTSVSLEPEFWHILDAQASELGDSLAGLIARLDDARIKARSDLGLAAYLRVWAVRQLQKQISRLDPQILDPQT